MFWWLASPGSGQTAVAELYDGTSWANTEVWVQQDII